MEVPQIQIRKVDEVPSSTIGKYSLSPFTVALSKQLENYNVGDIVHIPIRGISEDKELVEKTSKKYLHAMPTAARMAGMKVKVHQRNKDVYVRILERRVCE